MSLLTVVGILILAAVVLYAVNIAPFLDAQMKLIIRWVIIVAVILWLVALFFGVSLAQIRVGRP